MKVYRGKAKKKDVEVAVRKWKKATKEMFKVLGFNRGETDAMFLEMMTGDDSNLDEEKLKRMQNGKELERMFLKILLD